MSCNERFLSKGRRIIFDEYIGGIGAFLMASWSGLWIVYDGFGADMIDYEQYIRGRIEAPIPCQSGPRSEAILL